MKKLKLLVIAVTVLLLALFMFSCTASSGKDASREETSEDLKFETEQKTETEEYKRAASAVISLDEDAKKEIMHYLGYKSERKLFDLSDDTTYTSPRCYGEFNGCAVLAVRLGRLMETAKTVGESEFSSTYDIALFGYFDNTMYDLEDA